MNYSLFRQQFSNRRALSLHSPFRGYEVLGKYKILSQMVCSCSTSQVLHRWISTGSALAPTHEWRSQSGGLGPIDKPSSRQWLTKWHLKMIGPAWSGKISHDTETASQEEFCPYWACGGSRHLYKSVNGQWEAGGGSRKLFLPPRGGSEGNHSFVYSLRPQQGNRMCPGWVEADQLSGHQPRKLHNGKPLS